MYCCAIKVSSFGGDCTHTLGFVNLDLTVGPLRAAHRFHIINAQMFYHLLLERTWIHHYKAVPLTYLQYLKAIWKGRQAHLNATKSPFQRVETQHFSKAQYFNKLAKEGEVAIVYEGFHYPCREILRE